MKAPVRLAALLLILAMVAPMLLACDLFAPAPTPPPPTTFDVMLTVDEGCTVLSANPYEAAQGEDAVFKIQIKNGYWFSSVEGAVYDEATGLLTVPQVQKDTTVVLRTEELGYDTEQLLSFKLTCGEEAQASASLKNYATARAGTVVTVKAENTERVFVGWQHFVDGPIVCNERVYSFRLDPSLVSIPAGDVVQAFPVYKDTSIYYYNSNGGRVNINSSNLSSLTDYLSTTVTGDMVKVVLKAKYAEFMDSASTFWDDGTFYREGYVLKEYNTKADGTGESFSPGSKFYHVLEDAYSYQTLYCIWEKESPAEEFTYVDVSMVNPQKSTLKTWITDGVKITGYTGSSTTVTVPTYIGDKPVIGIGTGAFTNATAMQTLVLPRTLQRVEDGAFVGCSSLATLHFPDSVYDIANGAMDAVTYGVFRNFYVRATVPPRISTTEWGSMSVKLSRLLKTQGKKRVIVVAGSSAYESYSTELMNALLDGSAEFINFGTARTMNGVFFLEALSHYTTELDTVIYAPENSAYMMGETVLQWKTLYVLEGMYNLYRYVDVSHFSNLFDAFREANQERFTSTGSSYEVIVTNSATNRYGDAVGNTAARNDLLTGTNAYRYIDAYHLPFNDRFKSRFEGEWSGEVDNYNYKDPTDPTWCTITDEEFRLPMNRTIDMVKATGAKIYFGHAPIDERSVVDEARSYEVMAAYDQMIKDNYHFDGMLGESFDFLLLHRYFYNCAYHTNNYGRTYHTYRVYKELCKLTGTTPLKLGPLRYSGGSFDGCVFENESGEPYDLNAFKQPEDFHWVDPRKEQ